MYIYIYIYTYIYIYIYIYIFIYLLEPSKTSNMEPFANLVESIQLLTIFAKHSILRDSQMCLW